MRSFIAKTIALSSVFLLISCEPEITAGSSGTASSEDRLSSPVESFDPVLVSENGMLTVRNGRIDLCTNPEGIVSSDVDWNATEARTEGTQVWLKEANKAAVLWSAAGAISSSHTGVWLRDGTEIILKDAENMSELARVKVTSIACN